MNNMSQESWAKFKEDVIGPVNIVLDSDLAQVRKMDEVKRIELWNQIEHNQNIFEGEFITRLPRDIMLNTKSKFAFAKLFLAAAAHINNEESPITERFSDKELALVTDFEKFNVFDILSTEEIVDRIARRSDIYDMVMDFYKGQYSDLDNLLDDPEIEKDLKYAFKYRYKKRLDRIVESVKSYVGKYGPIVVVSQIEHKVWNDIKQSEEERKNIAESLRKRISEVATKLRSFGEIEDEGDLFWDRLRDAEREVLTGKDMRAFSSIEFDKDHLVQSYLGFEQEITSLIEATGERQKELAARETELEKARRAYEEQMQEDRQRLVESELKEIEILKSELASEARFLQDEKSSLELKREELSERLKQITEVAEGRSIRFVTKEDAKFYELNLIARFDKKMRSVPLKIQSPIEGKVYEIKSWNEGSHLKFAETSAPDTPSNAKSRYIIGEKKYGFFGEKIKKVIVEAMTLNHLKEFEDYGFDVRRANLAEFLSLIKGVVDAAEIGKYFHVLGIASPTGWDERVEKALTSVDFAHNYVSMHVSICLIDSVTGEVVYNPTDERITKFVDFFRPQFDIERVERIMDIIMRKLSEVSYVVFEDIVEELREDRTLVNKAFHDLDSRKKGRLRYIQDVGLVLEAVR
ncbi:hypothetical protein ACFLWV_03030 [Chloroflexota bacterium]